MSYTLAYKGAEIDDILGRAAPGGALDTAIAAKQDALTFDAVPTEGSTNPAESGGIYDAIQAGGAAALAAFPTDTVSGDVVSFPDGADGIPVKAFTGSILPQQNLNGQSAPYPAGGGKNKLPLILSAIKTANTAGTWSGNAYTIVGVTFTVLTDSVGNVTGIRANGTASATASVMIPASGITDGMILTGCPSGGSASTYQIVAGTSDARSATDNGTGATISGATDRVIMRVYSGTNVAGKTFYPMIRLSTEADATFAPYSNICPISGWSGAKIYRTGVNVWDEEWENGYYDSGAPASGTGIRSKAANYIGVKPNTTYYCKCGVSANIAMSYYDASQAYISNYVVSGGSGTFTTPSNCFYLRFHVASGYGATYNHDISINYPATDTAYHAYDGQTIVLTFGSTVYAGTITALGGGKWSIQPTYAMALLEDLQWERFTNTSTNVTYFRALPNPRSAQYATVVCSAYPWAYGGSSSLTTDNMCSTSADNILIRADSYTTPEAFVAAMSGVQLLYELRVLPDPIIVSAEDLQTLLGANTVWTDVGSVTGMTYRADTALYIDKKLGA